MKNKYQNSFIFILFITAMFSCSDNGKHLTLERTKKTGSPSSAGSSGSAEPAVTYLRDMTPIFQKACMACHNEGSAIPNWMNYDVTLAKIERLYDRVIVKKDMPLGLSISDEERKLIGEWIKLGAPYGTVAGSEAPTPEVTTPEDPPAVETPVETPPTAETPPEAEAPSPVQTPEPLNYKTIKALVFDKHCALCHNADSGPVMPNWGDYKTVLGFKDKIYNRVIVEKTMPPQGLPNPLTDEEKDLLSKWLQEGANE